MARLRGSDGRSLVVAGLVTLVALGCGDPGNDRGAIAVELHWLAPDMEGTRGVVTGLVDTVNLQARKGTRVVMDATCPYEDYTCDLLEVPAGSGYTVRAEALDGTTVAFRGEQDDVSVSNAQTTSVDVTMAAAYTTDIYPPAAVDDLVGAWVTTPSPGLQLTWTATGDDAWLGRASAYDVRWAFAPIDEAGFDSANYVEGPTPAGAGSAEQFLLRGLPGGHDVYVRLKVQDNATPTPNESGMSNEVVVTVP